MNTIAEISVPELRELLDDEPDRIRLIDVRSDAEVARGAIPSSEHWPLQEVPQRAGSLDQERIAVLYCHSGMRSAQACAFLSARGAGRVVNLRGGIIDWARHGLPLVAPGS